MTEKVKVLEKGIKILNIIGENKEPLTLAELTKKADLPKTTVARILNTYVETRFLEIDENQKYKLGLQILKLGTSMLNSNSLRESAREYAIKLRDKTNFTVFVGVLNGFDMIYIEKVPASITMTADVGARAPSHCTSIGKALLADLLEEEIDELLENNILSKRTEQTLITAEELKLNLEQIRTQGYAIDERENKDEIRCIAAPIKDHTGKAVAGISISSVLSLYDETKMEEYINNVKEAAMKISERLGYTVNEFS